MVKNNFGPEVAEAVNKLLTAFFQMNSFTDNVAYALQCELGCNGAGDIYHHKFAHLFPSDMFSDALSDILIHEGVRPVRGAQVADDKTYNSIVEAFDETYDRMAALKAQILSVIEMLDYNPECKIIVVTLEAMAEKASKLLRQCDIWRDKARIYHADNKDYKFDIDFEEFTHLV